MGLAMEKQEDLTLKKGVLPRFLVIKVLEALWQGNEINFTSSKGFKHLSTEDKAFSKLLYLTCLRYIGQIDALIDSLILKALDKKHKNVRDVLRLGVAQHHYLNTPPHAIISTSLDLLDKLKQPHFKAFAHAVLSKVTKNIHVYILKETGFSKNFPSWMVDRWKQQYGMGKSNEIIHALSKEAPTDFSVKGDIDYWAQTFDGKILPFNTIRVQHSAKIESLEGYNKGDWWVQDWSSALPVKLFKAESGKNALDVCAAPGGKTAQLLSLGLDVTSLDISEDRIKQLKINLKRLGMPCNIFQADAISWKSEVKFDYVLVDAPCSGTGTYRRHPERKFMRKEMDLLHLIEIQHEILKNSLQHLAPNGTLIYCTCSLENEENGMQIERILSQNNQFERIPFKASELPGCEFLINSKGDIQIFPFDLQEFGGTDGFFISRIRRKEAISCNDS